ncbi:MAG: hypothetical protein HY687_04760 [Chloroflexi bacterium]|nr:hypothetical protein [Chloroflexota bacterium]
MSSPRPLAVGVAAGALLISLFLVVLGVAESWPHAWQQFLALEPWLGLLAAGFGLQAGLFWHIRQQAHLRQAQGLASVAASGGVSGGAMVACCLHHGADVLPLLGLSALAPFLSQYQPFFLAVGLVANLWGILQMLQHIRARGLYQPGKGILGPLAVLNLPKVRGGVIALALVALPMVFWLNLNSGSQAANVSAILAPMSLVPQSAEAGGLGVEVSPRSWAPGFPVNLKVAFDTHQGSLSFDPAAVAVLEDSQGNRYRPLSWDGAPAGGHHREVSLAFPAVAPGARWMRLIVLGLYGVPERSFRWELR